MVRSVAVGKVRAVRTGSPAALVEMRVEAGNIGQSGCRAQAAYIAVAGEEAQLAWVKEVQEVGMLA